MAGQRQLRELTESYLKPLVAEAASLPPDFDSSAPFGELGVDSFRALKIIKKLEESFGILPKTLLFENFNVDDLTHYFVANHDRVLRARFAMQAQVSDEPPARALAQESDAACRAANRASADRVESTGAQTAAAKSPCVILAKDAQSDPELSKLVREVFERHKNESSISRGTRIIAPILFIGSDRQGYFNFSRHKNILLVYAYTGPREYFRILADEIHQYGIDHRLQLNILVDEALERVAGAPFTATPFGAIQRIHNLQEFTLEGGKMRRLRYQVSKFQQAGECRTAEYRCGSNVETDRRIVAIIDEWCGARVKVNPLVYIAREEILAGTFDHERHRVFLTYIGEALQNVIIISPMSAAANGYLMDLEFYPRDMPLGGLEFAIVNIIQTLVAEGCATLSLGATLGPKLAPSANADPGVDKILDELRGQNIFDDQGNLQFKNKFRPDNQSIFLCRPAGSGDPDNVIDIIMMIADPASVPPSIEPARRQDSANASRPVQVIEGSGRSIVLAQAGYNPLNIPHEHVEIDLKTDSWAELSMPAIDSRMRTLYGRLQHPVDIDSSLGGIFPFAHFVLTDSGRSAEHLFYSAGAGKGIVLQNLLFPSAIFNQIDKGYTGKELPCADAFLLQSQQLYKGDLDWQRLEDEIRQDARSIAFVCIEVGNNAVGGHPVSMQQLKRVRELLSRHSIALVIDATRVVENAAFIVRHEAEYSRKSVWEVVQEMLSLADTVVASLTKDFCVDKGGIIATNDATLFAEMQRLVESEGSGLDIIDKKLIALSLLDKQQLERDVLRRMAGVERIGGALREQGVPIVRPTGGHCILIDVKQIPEFQRFNEPAASFSAWVYLNTGCRVAPHNAGMQRGTALNDLVRLAVPIGLEPQRMEAIIEKLTLLFRNVQNIPEIEVSRDAAAYPGALGRFELKEYHNATGRIACGAPARDSRVPDAAAQPPQAPARAHGQDEKPHAVTHAPEKNRAAPLDIAVIGMSGRYPKARNLRELWDNLVAGKDCIEEIPAHRLQRRWRHEHLEKYRGGFVADVDRFDSLFFNISPAEAQMLDPQERFFLETAWEAVEDAGYFPEILAEPGKRNVGVFVGAVWAMYQMIGVEQRFAQNKVNPNSFFWSIANRVSYWMNLSGPSLTLDTACSSSLTAIYLACEAIRTGECSAAIAGGVNLDLHQSKLDINSAGGALSKDGVCRTFGKGANGYVAGEGVGAILLKPLADAIRDKDHIYGIIKSAVVNHGGRSSGYAVPTPKAQAKLIAAALDRAGVDARTLGYIEAHGTGTELGDPIEIAGLNDAFRAHQVDKHSCAIGSIKSNIGHLEAAAGVVGVCKVLLQMKHRQLVPSLHSSELNEHIDFESSPFYVEQTLEPWQRKVVDGAEYPLRAGISSFGAGGSNAHIIVEEYEAQAEPAAAVIEQIFPLSARNEAQLREQAVRLRDYLQRLSQATSSEPNINDVAYTLQVGRKSFEHRLAIVAATRAELLERLDRFIEGVQDPGILTGNASESKGITRLLDRQEKEEFVTLLSQRRDCRKLGQLWVGGLMDDWQGFRDRAGARRIPLPTYAFADKRHWACDSSRTSGVSALARAGVHPLLDSNESTFERQLFSKTFNDREFFIEHHVVSNIPTLPGVAYLELARKAGELAVGRKVRKIRNIVWVSPITVKDSTPTAALIELKPSGDSVQFEVFSESANGKKQLYSQGKLDYETGRDERAEPERIDLQAIRARCAKVIDGKDAYPLFRSLGLNLGPSFQVLREVFRGENEVLGALEIPAVRDGDFHDFVLHPSLVDGSFQAGMAAQLAAGGGGEMFVPYSIGEVEILQPLERACYSYVTEARGDDKGTSRLTRSNVLILDREGRVLVRIKESVGVPLLDVHEKPARGDADGFAKLYYSHVWEKVPLEAASRNRSDLRSILLFDADEKLRDLCRDRLEEAGDEAHEVVLVRPGQHFEALDRNSYRIDPSNPDDYGRLLDSLTKRECAVGDICFNWPAIANAGDPFEGDALKAALESGVYSMLRLCQAVVARKLESTVRILYLYSGGDSQPHLEAINGFAKSLQLEYPKLGWKTLELRQPNAAPAEVLNNVLAELDPGSRESMIVRYADAQRYVRKLKKIDIETAHGSENGALKRNGIYLITGGAGGLGLIFAEFLAKEYNARLALSGRSELSDAGQARLQEIREAGGEVTYIRADVAKRDDVRKLLAEIKSRFGGIDGIIHCAGVLRDSYIKDKTAADLDAVFAPKVHGTLYLDEFTKEEKLDFFAMSSSLAAVAGNVGQCDYAFANHFMDSFATQREALRAKGERSGKTLSLNWSIWADGGMRIDEQTELFFRKNLGIKPLSKETGLEAFVHGLRSSECQVAVVDGVQEKIERVWGLRKEKPSIPAASATPAAAQAPAPSPSAAAPDGSEGELRLAVQDELSRIVMEFLKLDASDIDVDKILLDLGFDSIGLATYANLINEKYRLDLTPVLFFEYPSVKEIAQHLVAEHKSALLQVHRASGAANSPAAAPSGAAVRAAAGAGAASGAEPTFRLKKGLDFAGLETTAESAAARQPFSLGARFADQPIAIVGMAGAMPQSEDLGEFWENLAATRDLVTVIPRDRWNWEDYYGDPLKEINKSNSKWGGFMKEVDKFDPLFFGISPREAELMDPQQRIFLQTVWKAIEDSGHKVADLSGTKTGLFVGVATNDYVDLMTHHKVPVHAYTSTGNSHSVLVNRVSFLLNLRGPSAPIDTACSSSLIALHRAVESIHTGSCDMAIVGGVQVMTSPAGFIAFGQAGMLSDDGKCKTFDKRANGYVRGEGVGAVLLKPLSMAQADGNHIYAVIKSTAENHGGKAAALTAPNPNAQAELLIEAYEKAGIDPATVGYIECHGTGTSLGDPIEIQALKKAFGDLYKKHGLGPPEQPHCGLSSAKTNIGHLETAAGIAGVVKVLLAIEHKKIPALVHFEEINPYINLKGSPFFVVDRTVHWPAPRAQDGSTLPRRAGVSSFGFGGANAHVVLEEYVPPVEESLPAANGPHLIVLSARNEDRLKDYARALLAHLERRDVDLRNLAYTLQVGRDPMAERLGVVVSSIDQLLERLRAYVAGGQNIDELYRGSVAGKGSMSVIVQDDDVKRTIVDQCIARNKLPRLLQLWVNGLDFDWNRLHEGQTPGRISLPTYPFARQRYWIDTSGPGATAAAAVAAAVPLRRANGGSGEAVLPGVREAGPATRSGNRWGELLAVPEWQASPISAPADSAAASYPNRYVVLCEVSGVSADQLAARLPGSHCLAIEAAKQTDIAGRFIDAASQCFALVQSVLKQEQPPKTLVQIVTRNHGEQATFAGLSGLLRTARLERPWMSGQVILVDREITPQELAFRLEQDRHKPQDALVKYQKESRQVLSWRCVHATWNDRVGRQDPGIAFKEQGVYLISGGLGGLGVLLAKEIIEQTRAARIVLAGRSELAHKNHAIVDGFAAAANRIDYRRADVADPGQAQQLVSGIVKDYGRLNGIIHCAGIVSPGAMANKTPDEIRNVLAPKVAGTVNLDEASRAVDLDFLVLFSSIVGAMGSPGMADYAAANAFMDHYASHRNELVRAGQRRGHTLAINWPLWRQGGMTVDPAGQEWLQQFTGMQPLQTATGMRAFHRSLELPAGQALIMEGDAARIQQFFEMSLQGARPVAHTAQPVKANRRLDRRTDSADLLLPQAADAKVSTLISLLKADLQAFRQGRH